MNFFTRIDCLNLTPGNKSAGFFLAVSVRALQVLSTLAISEDEKQRLLAEARTRVRNSGLLASELVDECGFELLEGTAVPRYFWVNRMFAASIGAEPTELADIFEPARARSLGEELGYTPHNVDSPQHALVLVILVQAWSEWAWPHLLAAGEQVKIEGDGHG